MPAIVPPTLENVGHPADLHGGTARLGGYDAHMDWTSILIGAVVGAGAGGAVAALFLWGRLVSARTRCELLQGDVQQRREEIEQTRRARDDANARREEAMREAAALTEKLEAREQQFVEQRKLLEDAQVKLKDAFRSVGAEALAANNKQFIDLAKKVFESVMIEAKGDVEKKQQAIDNLIKPIRELLEKHRTATGELEKKREVAYGRLEEHIKTIATSHEALRTATGRLVTALRRPEQRGRWGEMQLRNVVELAGMTAHCDFNEQVQTDDPATRDRPDMTVNLPGGGVIVVDSKVALDAYLDALEPDADRDARLADHAGQVEKHFKALAAKRYWEQFERTPKLVVMFLPLESALVAALERKPELHADAMQNHVLIATPTLLVALLRAVAYGWQQEAVAENAREIARVGQELYDRLATFVGHFEKVGAGLERSTRAYNAAVGSLDRMVLSSTRKLKELHATTNADIEPPALQETDVREFVAGELKSLGDADASAD